MKALNMLVNMASDTVVIGYGSYLLAKRQVRVHCMEAARVYQAKARAIVLEQRLAAQAKPEPVVETMPGLVSRTFARGVWFCTRVKNTAQILKACCKS